MSRSNIRSNRLPVFAGITAGLTFCLVVLGGLVHNTRSSLACPDWPLCYGQVFPRMEGGILVEHSHRLLATLVGVCTIGILIALWRRASATGDRGLRNLGIFALGLVVGQGVLGGLTVLLRLPTWTSTAHLAVSLLFFCTLLYVAFRTRRPREDGPREALPRAVRTATAIGAGALYLQMLLGALIRHLGAGLACVDVPLCKGEVWPQNGTIYLPLHMLHRLAGVVVFLVVCWVAVVMVRQAPKAHGAAVKAAALALPLLCAVQIGLGLLSITTFLDVIPVTAHLGVAAAMLTLLVSLHLVSRGELGRASGDEAPRPARAPNLREVAA